MWQTEWGGFMHIPSVVRNHPEPLIPAVSTHLYTAYTDLLRVSVNSHGRAPISYTEISNYCNLMDIGNPKFFTKVITAVDRKYTSALHEFEERKKQKAGTK